MQTAASSSAVATRGNTRGRTWGHGLLVTVASVAVVLIVAAYSVAAFGYVNGEEFDAGSFLRRKFEYREIPLLGWQITAIQRQDATNDLESYLISTKLIDDLKTPESRKRWDLVVARKGIDETSQRIISQGNARILCEYLDARDQDDESIWLDWSKEHPELARILWPAVARVARQELYILAPELLVCARSATDPKELQQEINDTLVERYVAFGRSQQQLSNHEVAVELFTEALRVLPTCSEALVGRANSLASLGKKELASADLAQVEQLGASHPK